MDPRLGPDCTSPLSPDPRQRDGDRLRQLFTAYQTFVGHDLPNQLVSVQAYAKLLDESAGTDRDEESRLLLHRITALSKKMGHETRRIFEIGAFLLEPPWGPPLALGEVAAEVAAGVRCRMDASKIDFRLPEADSAFPLSGALFHQVLNELLTNAVTAIGPGQSGRIAVVGEWSAEGGVLRVSDTGAGVPPERIDGLLRPTRMGGMLLVHQAAALWGGYVYIDSVVGQGTTISVTTGGRP